MYVDNGAISLVGNQSCRMFPLGTVQMYVGNTIIEEGQYSPFVADCLQRHGCSDTGELFALFERFEEVPMHDSEVLSASGFRGSTRMNPVLALTQMDRNTSEVTTNLYQPRCLFSLGSMILTPGVKAAFDRRELEIRRYLQDHCFGFWGSLSTNDVARNESAIVDGGRVCSRYICKFWDERKLLWRQHPEPLWIITEADRSVTTALWASEY